MEKKMPVYFDGAILSSPLEQITPNIGRAKVRVFTKYGNRNGSYITDAVAEQLIKSAINAPVIGFFDPSTQQWASHTGPTLASAYGFIESFVGWEPYEDTDGVSRDYAVFTTVLFTKYFDEANKIIGQNQSMELDINTITGDWADIDGQEYFVYTTAEILGCCVIGNHEPCFSVSTFFALNDQEYKTQYDKFSALCASMAEELKNNMLKGGEATMDELEKTTPVEEQNDVEPSVEYEAPVDTDKVDDEPSVEEEKDEVNNFEVALNELQAKFDELTANYQTLENNYNEAINRINELETNNANEVNTLNQTISDLRAAVATYEQKQNELDASRKEMLIEKYEKIINDAEEINNIKASSSDFSYEELESKLAIAFANQAINETNEQKVPLPDPQVSQFALFMKKYKKN